MIKKTSLKHQDQKFYLMSFRREIKSTLNKSKLSTLTRWIFDNNGKVLFPERIVNSIYFDNKNLNMFYDSVEGILPRKKIRLRIYKSNNTIKYFKDQGALEYKISSVEGRFKISKNSFDKNKNKPIYFLRDKDYGICNPVLKVAYLRTYYRIKGIRLTIDKSIQYNKINFSKILPNTIKDNLNVVELKYSNKNDDTNVLNSFPFQFNRFSKYCRGIEFTKKKYCDENI
mgnify:CR=1 FL=1